MTGDSGSSYDLIDAGPGYRSALEPVAPPQPRQIAFSVKIALLLAAFLLTWSVLEHRRSIAFAAYAEETTGTIKQKWVVHHRRSTSHYVSVAFASRDGGAYQYRERVGSWQWDKLKIEDTVPVWYVPSEPANFA